MLLDRIEHDNGVVTYRSPLLHAAGIAHGFSTRIGGISHAPFDSLNLVSPGTAPAPGAAAASCADDPRAVAENFRRLRAALGMNGAVRVQAKQVHGCGVHLATAEAVKPADAPEADAIVTDDPGAMATIRVADCVPILLASDDGRVVAAVHAGWRGVVAEVVPRTIAAMTERFGIDPRRTIAAIGPCISAAHFEVGPDVAAAFDAAGLSEAVQHEYGAKPHIDLPRAVLLQLLRSGLAVDSIDTTDRCTFRDADEFFSHRRDNGVTGRMAAVVRAKG